MFTSKKIIAGNWKMNGLKAPSWQLIEALEAGLKEYDAKNAEIVVCPPFTLISELVQMTSGSKISIGAQNASDKNEGAYTGEISPLMVKDLGAKYVILGHSERRQYYGETNELVASKAGMALQAGLTPIICIGETDVQYSAGKTAEVVKGQFANSVPASATPDNVIVAYEPVWAIGTGKVATTLDIITAHKAIREAAKEKWGKDDVAILYGGSVKGSNAAEILSLQGVDGVLVGGAALKADEFFKIIAGA
ncbi:MAG: triose-phosphate isomerase [Alphaproteobacteria bacterium]|nr:triose-phosphate isomerase [Alphaproteobacteria bacterium]